MSWRFIPCESCHLNSFDVRQDDTTGELQVICHACKTILLSAERPITNAAPAGPTHAPAGGPLRCA